MPSVLNRNGCDHGKVPGTWKLPPSAQCCSPRPRSKVCAGQPYDNKSKEMLKQSSQRAADAAQQC